MAGRLEQCGKRRVFILGAGFNAPLGMPLTAQLLDEVYAVAARKPWRRHDGQLAPHGMADWLVDALNWYYPTAHLDHGAIASGDALKRFNLEEFLSFVAATSAMQLSTGERWDEQGDQFSGHVKSWLGEAIERQQREAIKSLPDYYLKFTRGLHDAVVLTFNWNTLSEELLEREGIRYAFDLDSALSGGAVPVIKLHGSVDWFSLNLQDGSRPEWLDLEPLGASFNGLGRARGDVLRYYDELLTPWIVIPSYDKIVQVLNLGEVWQLPWLWLEDALEIIIIGYSIRPDDYHSRAFMYPQLVRGSRAGALRVKVVDHADTPEKRREVEQRFAGVQGCRFCFDGFSEQALDFIDER
jgi:hypothetical protein